MTKRKVMVSSTGQTAESTKEIGKTESNMGKAYTLQHQAKLREANGLKEKELLGSDYQYFFLII